MPSENSIYTHAAEREMSYISRGLDLDILRDHNQIILEIYNNLFSVFRKRSKYRLPANLIPLIIFIYFRLRNLVITKSQLLLASHTTNADFNDFIMQLQNYLTRRDIR